MGRISTPAPVQLFTGILSSRECLFEDIEPELAALFGPILDRSELFPFPDTSYYDREMGTPIRRRFLAFSRLIDPGGLAEVKIRTNSLEEAFAAGQTEVERPVNLDPGYLEEAKVVLASTKNFSHRVLVARGIYAEVTLQYRNGAWQPLPWTFPDFRSGRYDSFFERLRRSYREQLRLSGKPNP